MDPKTKKLGDVAWFTDMITNAAEDLSKAFKIHDTIPMPEPVKVVFNDPVATIVYWSDGSDKTIVRCQSGDTYDKEKGLLLCIAKKAYGDTGAYNKILKGWLA